MAVVTVMPVAAVAPVDGAATIDDLEFTPNPPAAVQRHLTRPLGTTDVALNYYELEQGIPSRVPTTTTGARRSCSTRSRGPRRSRPRPVTSKSGRARSFGSHRRAYKRGTNRDDDRVVGLALGAPLDYGEMDPRRNCPDCGAFTTRASAMDGDDYAATCTDYGTETGRWPPVDAR